MVGPWERSPQYAIQSLLFRGRIIASTHAFHHRSVGHNSRVVFRFVARLKKALSSAISDGLFRGLPGRPEPVITGLEARGVSSPLKLSSRFKTARAKYSYILVLPKNRFVVLPKPFPLLVSRAFSTSAASFSLRYMRYSSRLVSNLSVQSQRPDY